MKKISVPTLLIDENKIRNNIIRMAEKARKNRVRFRPHFKTHQSIQIGELFRLSGVNEITVSSLSMAQYFAGANWKDILVAFPVNTLEIKRINRLASEIRLGLLVESEIVVRFLNTALNNKVDIWIKIDSGAGRTGIMWTDKEKLFSVASQVLESEKMRLRGMLTHAGHTYRAPDAAEIKNINRESTVRMNTLRNYLAGRGLKDMEISTGDTPGCSVAEEFKGTDEIRPGNFVFYDIMQESLGSCKFSDIAMGLACPVVSKRTSSSEIVVYGGAVHLSKDFILQDGKKIYGKIALPDNNCWPEFLPDSYVRELSQEHGIIRISPEHLDKISEGDIIIIIPVHSCLAAAAMREYRKLTGETIKTMPLVIQE